MKLPHRPSTPQEFKDVTKYEEGFREGHKAGHADKKIGLRSALYWGSRDASNPFDQGYNDGYVQGRR